MDDLEKKIKEVEDLPNKQIKVKGFKFSWASIMALFCFNIYITRFVVWRLFTLPKGIGTCLIRPR